MYDAATMLLTQLIASAASLATFAGVGDVRINYRVERAPTDKATVVILPGYSESYLLYDELITDLHAQGFGVAIMDHRGMGLSERLAPNPGVVHVERFGDYVADARKFIDIVAAEEPGQPLFLFAHSTGGLIGANVLAEEPERFKAAVLSAPLFDMNTGGLPDLLVYGITRVAASVGYAGDYAPGNADYPFSSYVFENNRTTNSPERFEIKRQVYLAHPEIFQSGPSNGWVAEALRATWAADELAPTIKTPLLILQAGDDHFVGLEAQAEFCKLAPTCRLQTFATARHELVQAQDADRKAVLDALFAHFSQMFPVR